MRRLKAEHALRAEHGFDVAWLDRSEIAARFGFKATARFRAGAMQRSMRIGSRTECIAEAARRGARVYDRTDVTKVRDDRNGVTLTTNRGRTVRARRLVVAAGYEVARQLRQDRGHLHSTWAFVSEPVPDLSWWPDRCLIWETRRPYLYLRTTSDGRVMVGGEDEPWSSRHENTRLLARKTERLLEGLLEALSESAPRGRLRVGWSIRYDSGWTPLHRNDPEHPHTFFALGYGGNGITFSVVAAELVRDWWTGRPNPDAALFAFDR